MTAQQKKLISENKKLKEKMNIIKEKNGKCTQ